MQYQGHFTLAMLPADENNDSSPEAALGLHSPAIALPIHCPESATESAAMTHRFNPARRGVRALRSGFRRRVSGSSEGSSLEFRGVPLVRAGSGFGPRVPDGGMEGSIPRERSGESRTPSACRLASRRRVGAAIPGCSAMQRTFVGFDDSYRVPVPVNVSRAVACGGTAHLCGQLHMDGAGRAQDPGDLAAQSEGTVRRLHDVLAHAGLSAEDLAQIQVFYRHDGGRDEDAYLRQIAGLLREGSRPVVLLTPVDSFPSAGIEVEIDAIAVRDRDRAGAAGPGGARARRHGDAVFAAAVPTDLGAAPEAQAEATLDALFAALDGAGAGAGDICRLALYLHADPGASWRGLLERVGGAFSAPGPVFETMLLTRLGRRGEALRVEAVALRGTADGTRPVRRLSQDAHWRRPDGGPWSQALRSGEMVFVGAQMPVDAAGRLVGEDDLAAQTHAAMRHMEAALVAVESGFHEVVKVNARFTGDWDESAWGLNVGIRSDYYAKPGPASTGIVVPRLEIPGAMIQAGCVAMSG